MVVGNPVVRRRQLGKILAAARERAKVTRETAGATIETSPATIGRIERGEVTRIKLKDLRALLDLYEVRDTGVRAECEELAQGARESGWWYPYRSALRQSYERLLGLEGAASEIRTYQSVVIPGILQTEAYARAMIGARRDPALAPDVIDDRVSVRLARQERLFATNGPVVHVVIDESALLRQVGGVDVWREQLRHLADVIYKAPRSVLVQVLRFNAGAPPTVTGPFMLLRLREPNDAWLAYTETPTGDRYEEGEEVDAYQTIFSHLIASAISPRDTRDLIGKILANQGIDE